MAHALLVATTNAGKLREIRDILRGVDVALRSLADVPPVAEPREDGETFAVNAREKAIAYARATGLVTVAEDSGLEIDALGGAPGVRSARFPGETYPEKFATLFRLLDERGRAGRTARFVCALAVAAPDGRVLFEARGTVEGEITREPRGEGGFGYDPVFLDLELGRTAAELTAVEKHARSHRGKALRQLIEQGIPLARRPALRPG